MDAQLVSGTAAETVNKMKSFKQFKTQINELFDKPARWKLVKNDSFIEYRSSINGKKLEVIFDKTSYINNTNNWKVLFNVDGKYSFTGEGDEVKVLSTVLDIMSDFIKTKEPDQLIFAAEKSVNDSDSRIRVYNRLIKRFATSHGYILADKNDQGGRVSYKLAKA